MAEEMKDLLLTDEEMDDLCPTKEEQAAFLAEPTPPDDFNQYLERTLPPEIKLSVAFDAVHCRKVAKSQLAKLLNAPLEGGTDAISWGKGLQDGIKRERERIQVWGPEPCPHFDGYEKRECSLCWEDLFKGES